MKVFWSWQSDEHQPSGRYFVRDALKRVCLKLADSPELESLERPEIDYDTLDVPGTPPITDTILKKIREAAVFVADVTPVATTKAGKKVANPNVMIELGYALGVLTHQRVVLVMNTAEGASLKHLPFDLGHCRKPIDYSLRADTPDEKIAKVESYLIEALHDAILPSLKFASAIMREEARHKNRMPELAVVFHDGMQSMQRLQLTQLAGDINAKSLKQVKLENPLLPMPSTHFIRPYGQSSRLMSSIGVSRPPSQWDPDEVEGYNRFLEQFYGQWQCYLADLLEWSLLMKRVFPVDLLLLNSGTATATNIDVEIFFPLGVRLFERERLPSKPEAPKPPPLVPLGRGQGVITEIASSVDFESLMPRRSDTLIVNVEENSVTFRAEDLKHTHQINLPTFMAGFPKRDTIKPFELDYVVTANEPIEPVTGALRIEVDLDGSSVDRVEN